MRLLNLIFMIAIFGCEITNARKIGACLPRDGTGTFHRPGTIFKLPCPALYHSSYTIFCTKDGEWRTADYSIICYPAFTCGYLNGYMNPLFRTIRFSVGAELELSCTNNKRQSFLARCNHNGQWVIDPNDCKSGVPWWILLFFMHDTNIMNTPMFGRNLPSVKTTSTPLAATTNFIPTTAMVTSSSTSPTTTVSSTIAETLPTEPSESIPSSTSATSLSTVPVSATTVQSSTTLSSTTTLPTSSSTPTTLSSISNSTVFVEQTPPDVSRSTTSATTTQSQTTTPSITTLPSSSSTSTTLSTISTSTVFVEQTPPDVF